MYIQAVSHHMTHSLTYRTLFRWMVLHSCYQVQLNREKIVLEIFGNHQKIGQIIKSYSHDSTGCKLTETWIPKFFGLISHKPPAKWSQVCSHQLLLLECSNRAVAIFFKYTSNFWSQVGLLAMFKIILQLYFFSELWITDKCKNHDIYIQPYEPFTWLALRSF